MSWTLTEGFADPALFDVVRDQVAWTTQMASRQTASMGIPYNYAGASYPEAPWHPTVWDLAQRIGDRCGFVPTNALLNRYPTGEHRIGYHRDDVSILAPDTPITIVSLGAPRTLLLRQGLEAPFTVTRVPLPPGSLFVMSATMQADHKHGIAPEPGAGERISVTVRQLTHAPPPVTRPR